MARHFEPSGIYRKDVTPPKRGRLVRILKEWETVEFSLFAVYANRQFLPLKVRSFIDFLVDYFGPQPYWRLPK